uniref:Sulfotransferase n=1 Tax=Oryza meridionalis TaxID=40149 RepID=A0A0E0FB47_9ORYZ
MASPRTPPQDGGAAIGPVPFKDFITGSAAVPERPTPAEEHAGVVSALPSYPKLDLRCYQGTWLNARVVPGIIAAQRGLAPRRGDIVVASPAKCGTTWLIAHAFATVSRGAHPPPPFLEGGFGEGWGSVINALPSPRIVYTHMQHAALPPSITDNPDCKVVYICRFGQSSSHLSIYVLIRYSKSIHREPKDMLVSAWHFARVVAPSLPFHELFESACESKFPTGAIWDHILGYWNASKASPEKVLFLLYEDMLRDPITNVRKLAAFLVQPFSLAEEDIGLVTDIVGLCSFERMKSLKVNKTGEASSVFPNASYFRRGTEGDWKNHMTVEMAQRFDGIIREKLHGSGLVFA